MTESTKITTDGYHGFQPGDVITLFKRPPDHMEIVRALNNALDCPWAMFPESRAEAVWLIHPFNPTLYVIEVSDASTITVSRRPPIRHWWWRLLRRFM